MAAGGLTVKVEARPSRLLPWAIRGLRVCRFFRVRLSEQRADRLIEWLLRRSTFLVDGEKIDPFVEL
jgi:hypothetical protein